MIDVYLNEKFIGDIEDPIGFVKQVRQARRAGNLPNTLNIAYSRERGGVFIRTSKGRARRPLIVVEDGRLKLTESMMEMLKRNELTWKDIVNQGAIEYLDAAEEEDAFIAVDNILNEHTHKEIIPSAILGPISSLVPYSNFCQAPRLNRGSKSQKQALGIYATNFFQRIDTDVSILHYPQRPITQTFMNKVIDQGAHASGQNIIIAVMSYEGQNMKDGIIINKGSVDRGLARSSYFRAYTVEELRYPGGLSDEICYPGKDTKGYKSEKDYMFLEDDGIVYPEAKLSEENIIVGKTSPPRFLGELEEFNIAANVRRESSISVRAGESGVVDLVVLTENEEGNRLVQVRLRDLRIPELGDKFASRHGQKGVIGSLVEHADMPFTASGIVPDIIFSPHSIPSRMTISHMLEMLAGKVGCMGGRYVDGTPFESESEFDLRKELLKLGFREDGTERMYNGITGEMFECEIFIGNMYYQKLKHMVANKLHARASGRIQLLTRQPIEGRSKGGGLRLGEMEKDCLVSHGASMLLKERFDSDNTRFYVCETCGLLATYDSFRKKKYCTRCDTNTGISAVEMSYAFKLLLDELKALGIYPRLKLKNKTDV